MAGPALPLKATVNCDMGEVRLRRSYFFIGAFELTPSDASRLGFLSLYDCMAANQRLVSIYMAHGPGIIGR